MMKVSLTKPKEHVIEALKLIRWVTNFGLKESKDILDMSLGFDIPASLWPEFKTKADVIGAKVTIIEGIPSKEVEPTIRDVVTELRQMRRELAGLRRHLGLQAFE